MNRKSLKLLALVIAVLLALTGCNLVKVDETMDGEQVIATFNGGTVTKGEVASTYEYYVQLYAQYSEYYGVTFSTAGLLERIVEQRVENKVLLNKVQELGITLSDEELTEINDNASATYEETIQQYWSEYAEDGLTEEEIRAQVENLLNSNGYTLEALVAENTDAVYLEKIEAQVKDGVTVTEDAVKAEYDTNVANDEANYTASNINFESAVSNGSTIYWYPEGYRTVKQILVLFTEEQRTALIACDSEIASLDEQIEAVNERIAAGVVEETAAEETASAEDTTTEVAVPDEEALVMLQEQKDAAVKAKEEKLAAYAAEQQGKIDEIMAKIEAGEDFDALIAEYGEDAGMTSEPGMTQGYYVSAASTNWIEGFTTGAMALEQVGDVSQPVLTNYGVHIIRYNSDVTPGAVAYEDIKDVVENTVLTEAQNAAYDEQVAAWVAEANPTYDYSSMK